MKNNTEERSTEKWLRALLSHQFKAAHNYRAVLDDIVKCIKDKTVDQDAKTLRQKIQDILDSAHTVKPERLIIKFPNTPPLQSTYVTRS